MTEGLTHIAIAAEEHCIQNMVLAGSNAGPCIGNKKRAYGDRLEATALRQINGRKELYEKAAGN